MDCDLYTMNYLVLVSGLVSYTNTQCDTFEVLFSVIMLLRLCRLHNNIILIYFIEARFHANKKNKQCLEYDSTFFGTLYLIICNILFKYFTEIFFPDKMSQTNILIQLHFITTIDGQTIHQAHYFVIYLDSNNIINIYVTNL